MKPLYILRRYCTGKTAFSLEKFIEENTGLDIKNRKTYQGYPPLIRWGNSDNPVENDTKFNDPNLIQFTANKLKLSRLLSENNIPCITFQKGEPEKYPVVIRQKISGQGGVGIVVVHSRNEWIQFSNCYWSYFIPFKYEIRLHVLGGEPVKILKKTLLDGQTEDEYPIRNNDRKYHYRIKNLNNKFYKNALELASKIYKVFPIQMVGWDMGYMGDGKFCIIEGNSAPSLNSLNIEIYGNFLLKNLNLGSGNLKKGLGNVYMATENQTGD